MNIYQTSRPLASYLVICSRRRLDHHIKALRCAELLSLYYDMKYADDDDDNDDDDGCQGYAYLTS